MWPGALTFVLIFLELWLFEIQLSFADPPCIDDDISYDAWGRHFQTSNQFMLYNVHTIHQIFGNEMLG